MIKKIHLLFFAITCFVAIIIYSCKKDSHADQQNAVSDVAVAQAKSWYESTYPVSSTPKQTTQSINTPIDLNQLIKPDWHHTDSYTKLSKGVIEMPVDPGQSVNSVLKSTTNNKIFNDKANSRSSFIFLKDSSGYKAYLMVLIGDPAYLKNNPGKLALNTYRKHEADFSGLVLYFTPQGQYLNGYKYQNGQLIAPFNDQSNDNKIKVNEASVVMQCTNYYVDTYVNDQQVDSHYAYTECLPISVSGGSGGGGGGSIGGGSTGGGGNSAGTDSPPPPPNNPCDPKDQNIDAAGKLQVQQAGQDPAVPVNPDGSFPPPANDVPCSKISASAPVKAISIAFNGTKIDPKKETKCFDKTQSAQMTIYVQQPNPNTRDMLGANSVGHTFVGITQGGVTRNFGFYPDSPNAAVLTSQNSEIHENSGELYHVSISVSITPAQLTNVINYINNYPPTYTLKSYNCTDFGIAVAAQGGLILPATTGTTTQYGLTFSGRNPGDLGQDIRSMTLPTGAIRNQGTGNAPNKSGTCP